MKRVLLAAAAGCLAIAAVTGSAVAALVAPGDVKMEDGQVKASLTGSLGNAEKGRECFANRNLAIALPATKIRISQRKSSSMAKSTRRWKALLNAGMKPSFAPSS